jgi:glutamate synthase domain-containing protein 3
VLDLGYQADSEAALLAAAALSEESGQRLYDAIRQTAATISYTGFREILEAVVQEAGRGDLPRAAAINGLTLLLDRRYDPGDKKRSNLLHLLMEALIRIFQDTPLVGENGRSRYHRLDWDHRALLQAPPQADAVLVLNAAGFPPEGEDCDARLLCQAFKLGWRQFITYGYQGQRFLGCGFGPDTQEVRIDAYGSTGDYLASGIDGMTLQVHGNAQDQLGQIMKQGKLVVHGDVGQTFMYGAKGGEVYILGNAAGRPLINAVGRPRVVINGTALDFLAESFMAGDVFQGGGFVIVNGLEYDPRGRLRPQRTPYPGSNLFSLASGGAIYIRDPYQQVVEEQLNGGEIVPLTEADWNLILPYLQENQRLFDIAIDRDLLTVDGRQHPPDQVYRKIQPLKLGVLTAVEDSWE